MKATERLFFNADRTRVVKEGDRKAAFLYAAPGDEIPEAACRKFGLADGGLKGSKSAGDPAETKPTKPVADKAKKPAANKGRKPAANKSRKPEADKSEAGSETADKEDAPEAPAGLHVERRGP